MIRIKKINSVNITEHIKKIEYSVYNDGGCQCFKDCDCYLERGFKPNIEVYKHYTKLEFDNLEDCQKDLDIYLASKEKELQHRKEALEYFNSLSIKGQNKLIHLYKSNFKHIKKQHKEIIENDNYKVQIYRTLLKNNLLTN